MASPERVAAAHQRQQAALARRTASNARRLWAGIDRSSIGRSWAEQLGRLFAIVSGAQVLAAAAADGYVDAALAAQEATGASAGAVRMDALAGIASDGRPLTSLLYQPAISTLTAIGHGATPTRALMLGQAHLDMIVRTQVADAGRVADGVALAARPHARGYIRMVSAGACSRCIVLAGKHYAWNAGFLRHPRCHCVNIPAAEDMSGDVRTDPRMAFEALSRAEQDKTFTAAGAEAIRGGSDPAKVVNARRGMYTAGGRQFTHEAAGRRPRLMPEQIYREANGNREEAIRLLRLHGYIL